MQVISNIMLVAACFLALAFFGWAVHCAFGRLCVWHARRFCERGRLEVCRARWQPQFDSRGVKTEQTLVQLDCFDVQRERRLVLLSVWPLGVRGLVTNEPFSEFDANRWP